MTADELWSFLIRRVDWAAWATLAVVLVALYPIVREHRRSRAQARNLRIRLGAELMKLRPTLASRFLPPSDPSLQGVPILNPAQFKDVVHNVNGLLAQGAALEADELDQVGMTYLNLVAASEIFPAVPPDSAKNILSLIDRSMDLFSKHGFTITELKRPWKK